MEISKGFKIDVPSVFIPWGISEDELVSLLGAYTYKRVGDGYYTLFCESLGGLKCLVGFHFSPTVSGKLSELQFFRGNTSELESKDGFTYIQSYFEQAFGAQTKPQPDGTELVHYEWLIDDVFVTHYLMERFGIEEHAVIQKLDPKQK